MKGFQDYSNSCRGIFWIAGDAKIRPDLFKLYSLEMGCFAGSDRALTGESWDWSAGENWPDVNLDLVDQTFIQRLSKNVAAPFNHHACNLFRADLRQNRRKRFISINMRILCAPIRENARLARQLSGTRDDNARWLSIF